MVNYNLVNNNFINRKKLKIIRNNQKESVMYSKKLKDIRLLRQFYFILCIQIIGYGFGLTSIALAQQYGSVNESNIDPVVEPRKREMLQEIKTKKLAIQQKALQTTLHLLQEEMDSTKDQEKIKSLQIKIKSINEKIEKIRKKTTTEPINCKYTQAEAYLIALNGRLPNHENELLEKETENLLQIGIYPNEEVKTRTQDILKTAIEREKTFSNYYVLYNGFGSGSFTYNKQPYMMLFDLYQMLSSKFNLKTGNNINFRIGGRYAHILSDIKMIRLFVHNVTDHFLNDLTISASPFIFSADGGDSAWSFFTDESENTINPEDKSYLLDYLFLQFGFDNIYKKQLLDLYNQYFGNVGGFLMQIFMSKNLLNRTTYAAVPQGISIKQLFEPKTVTDLIWCYDGEFIKIINSYKKSLNKVFISDQFSDVLDFYRNDPLTISSNKDYVNLMTNVQGRIWASSPDLGKVDSSQLKIFIYSRYSDINWKQYRKDLGKICDTMIAKWIDDSKNDGLNKNFKQQGDFLLPDRLEKLTRILKNSDNPSMSSKNQKIYLDGLKSSIAKFGQDKKSFFSYWNQKSLTCKELVSCLEVLESLCIANEYFSDIENLLDKLDNTELYRILEAKDKLYNSLGLIKNSTLSQSQDSLQNIINAIEKRKEKLNLKVWQDIEAEENKLLNKDVDIEKQISSEHKKEYALKEIFVILETQPLQAVQKIQKLIDIAIDASNMQVNYLIKQITESSLIQKSKDILLTNIYNELKKRSWRHLDFLDSDLFEKLKKAEQRQLDARKPLAKLLNSKTDEPTLQECLEYLRKLENKTESFPDNDKIKKDIILCCYSKSLKSFNKTQMVKMLNKRFMKIINENCMDIKPELIEDIQILWQEKFNDSKLNNELELIETKK